MNKKTTIALIALMLLSACATPPTKTQQGAVIGTGIGAAAGAGLGQAIGGDTQATLLGAAIGAAVGGFTGGGVGRYMEMQESAMRQALIGVEGANIQRNADLLAVSFKSDVLFGVNSSAMKAGSYSEISRVAGVLNQYPQTNIMIAGHTDSSGAEDYNLRLSQQRANAVKNALIGQGVSASRINAIGYGEAMAIADNSTAQGQQLNRRVEITITPL